MECSDCHRRSPAAPTCSRCVWSITARTAICSPSMRSTPIDFRTGSRPGPGARRVLRASGLAGGAPPGRPMRMARRPVRRARSAHPGRDRRSTGVAEGQRAAADVFERTSCKVWQDRRHRRSVPRLALAGPARSRRSGVDASPGSIIRRTRRRLRALPRCRGRPPGCDVNMPAIESCRDCHGGGEATTSSRRLCRVPQLPSCGPRAHET